LAVDFRPLADYASDTTNKEDRVDFMTGLERRTIKANGIKINLWVGGNGPPVLLLHGWPPPTGTGSSSRRPTCPK